MWRWNIPILDDSVDYLRIIVFLRQSMTGAFNRTNRYTSMFISNYVLDSTQFNLPVLQQSISNYSLIFVIYVHWCAVAILTRYIYMYTIIVMGPRAQLIGMKIPCWWILITPTTPPSISNYECLVPGSFGYITIFLGWIYNYIYIYI